MFHAIYSDVVYDNCSLKTMRSSGNALLDRVTAIILLESY